MSGVDSKKRLVRSRSGLRVVNLDENRISPFELREPFWVPDEESPTCGKCQAKFDFITRRHHCRRCGNVFCKRCCEQKLPLPRMCFVDPVRICSECVDITKRENEFYDKHLKVLLSGANFIINDKDCESYSHLLCCLSSDHQVLMFQGENVPLQIPINLSNIVSLKVLGSQTNPGSTQIMGAIIKYSEPAKDEREIHVIVPDISNQKQSIAWISALQKALKILTAGTQCL